MARFSIGRTILTTHRYSDAVDWFRKAAVADPSRPDLWNSLAYAQAYAGDLEGARASLASYEEAEPDNPNSLDSLGEVYFHHGRFAEAERFFLATHQKGPSFRGGVALMKAARARLMTSEAAGAEQLFLQYVQLREQADDPLLDYLAARWRYWTGRRRQAMADLEELGRREGLRPEIASLAFAQLSIWALETGQALSARDYAGEAVDAAGPSATTAGAALCQFLTQPPVSAAEWEDRARRAFPHPSHAGLRKQVLAYALLFSKQFPEAGAVLREMYEEAAPFTRGELRVLLAWTLIESGQFDEARALLSVHAVLQPGGESLLHGLVLPRAFYLRGVLAQQSGDEQAARDHYQDEAPEKRSAELTWRARSSGSSRCRTPC